MCLYIGKPFLHFRVPEDPSFKAAYLIVLWGYPSQVEGNWDLLPWARGRLSSATAVPAGATVLHRGGKGGGKGQPTHVILSSYAGNAFAAQSLSLALAARNSRVLSGHLSCWHPDTPSVHSTSWVWVARRLTQGKGVCASYSHVKITCLLWNLSPPTCAV